MITFTHLGNYGRLGNQLFQYAVLRAVSLERGYEMKIPNPADILHFNQRCQLDQFNIKCDFLERSDIETLKYRFIEPHHSMYYPQVFDIQDNTDLFGYFQNYCYFSKYKKEIIHDLQLTDTLQELGADYVNSLKTNNEEIVSVHFRRGDNTDGTGGQVSEYYGKGDKFSPESIFGKYFFKAMEIFENKNVKFLVFSGGSRKGMNHNQSDIDWCKENIKSDKFLFCEGHSDIEDFAIMKNCDHNVVSHSTSFGYWASLLNENEDKVVVAPLMYTIPDDGRVARGFYPTTWRII